MGIDKDKFSFIERNVKSFDKLIMMELGNQKIKKDLSEVKTGKEFWSSLGCYHFSIDINGKDDTISMDLSLPITYYDNFFDIVTNITVSNYIKNYNACYDNIYRFCKVDGMLFHCLPKTGSKWTASHYANKKFYQRMAIKYNLDLIDYDEIKNKTLTLAAFKK